MNTTLPINQGSTFQAVFRWESSTWAYGAISAISKAAPAVLTVDSAPPDGWRVWVTGCKGMTQINAEHEPPLDARDEEAHKATLNDSTHVELNDVNSTNYGTYTSGGVLAWKEPVDLTGYTARMQVREAVDSSTTLLDLSTTTGEIVIDNTAKTVTVTVDADATAALTWESAVFDLEMVSAAGVVTRIAQGTATVSQEVTR